MRDVTVQPDLQHGLDMLHTISASPFQGHELASDKSKHITVSTRLHQNMYKISPQTSEN